MPTEDILMTRVVPSFGVFIGTLMFLSPLKAVMDMRKSGRIGVSLGYDVEKSIGCQCSCASYS